MRRRLATIILAIFLALGWGFALAAPAAHAEDILKDACSGAAADTDTCKSRTNKNPLTGPNGTLTKVANVVAVLAGVAAILMLIYSGIQYITSSGDTQKATSAKNTIIGALVGLVVIVLARSIIAFIVNRL